MSKKAYVLRLSPSRDFEFQFFPNIQRCDWSSEIHQTANVKPANPTAQIHRAKNTPRNDRRITKVETFSHVGEINISTMNLPLVERHVCS